MGKGTGWAGEGRLAHSFERYPGTGLSSREMLWDGRRGWLGLLSVSECQVHVTDWVKVGCVIKLHAHMPSCIITPLVALESDHSPFSARCEQGGKVGGIMWIYLRCRDEACSIVERKPHEQLSIKTLTYSGTQTQREEKREQTSERETERERHERTWWRLFIHLHSLSSSI